MSTSLHSEATSLSAILSKRGARIHMLGILGVSMSSLAEHLFRLGHYVTGSDLRADSDHRLSRLGIKVSHRSIPADIIAADAVIATGAIPWDSPELSLARENGIPIFKRAELLGEIMLGWRRRVGISGTHGKSTTTAMLHKILTYTGASPTTFSGAILPSGAAHEVGTGDIFLYEACEYKNSYHAFSPTLAVINSIELDHTDFFHNEEELLSSFFLSTRGAECVIINIDYPLSVELVGLLEDKRVITVGRSDTADYAFCPCESTDGEFWLTVGGERNRVRLAVFGDYNAANATAAIAAAEALGIDRSLAISALTDFRGASGRCERVGSIEGKDVILDYAHHPTEVRLAIASLVRRFDSPTIVFRPHTYTRTRDLWDGFVASLSSAPRLIITDVYAARESAIAGCDAPALAGAIDGAEYVPYKKLAERLSLIEGDSPIVLMGAGDFSEVLKELGIEQK